MFKIHKAGFNTVTLRNLVILFLTIVLGLASVITLAQVNISSDINNAWQTIGRVTISSGGTENGTRFFDFNYSGNGDTYINPTLFPPLPSFAGRVLGIDDSGNLISVYSSHLLISGSNIIVAGSGDDDWTMVGNDMYATHNGNIGIGTETPAYKLHIVNSGSTDVYIEEKASGMAANLNLKNPARTWTMGADSYPDVFYIGIPNLPQFFSISSSGYVGIDTNYPQEKLEVSGGNIRINNLKNKIVLGTDANGTIKDATSGDVYNFISGFALSGPRGATGPVGPQGIQGNTGAQGATGPAGVGSGIGDNLGNHTATTNLLMGQYRIAYNGFTQGLHILPDGRTQVFSTIQVANLSGLACDSTNSGTIKYIPNCFQGCDGTNWITLGGTCIGLQAICGDGTITAPEQCDDSNTNNGDGCNSNCQREVPICNFTFTPTTGSIPLQATFRGVEQDRATYGLNFGNGYSINNQRPFSGTTYTYQSIGEFVPQLTVKNKYNINTQTTCYAAGGTTGISINSSCGDGILTAPEQCDDGNGNNNDGCVSCQRETPNTCTISATPNTGEVSLLVNFTGTNEPRESYRVNFGDGTTSYQNIFSGSTHTYQNVGVFTAALVVYNKNDTTKKHLPCYTTITISSHCGNGIKEGTEQCDDGNNNNNDGCTHDCTRETPTCDFSMNPTTGNTPLTVTFQGTEQNRTIYRLRFGNGQGISNQTEFSGITYIYQSTGTVVPHLTVKNKYNLATETGCEAGGSTTSITITETPKYCGDGMVQTPNSSGDNEQCDLGTANSLTGKCGIDCTYNIPDCNIFASPSIFTGGSGATKLTGQISPRANYVIRTTLPDGSQTTHRYSEFKLQTGFEITNQYDTTGEYTITLVSNDGVGASCSTIVNVYDNGEYACGRSHKTDQISLIEGTQGLCAQGYKAINFTSNSGTIEDVGPGKDKKHAIIIPQSTINDYLSQFTYIDTGKNMVQFSGGYYIRFLRSFMNININILLPQQGFKYRTRDCVNSNDDKTIVSSCYAHKTLNGDCAYDMNIDGALSSRYFTTQQINEAMANSGYLFKCALVENENSITEVPQYKFTRGLPTQGGRGNEACQVIPVGSQTEQNLYYVHRVCPGYNYGQSSQSCDSILLSGQGIVSCAGLLAELYTSWGTGGFSTQR